MNEKEAGEAILSVLVVEDDADAAETLAWLLRFYGHKVEVARDGPTALRTVENGSPDVVILDLSLSDEMDGWEVARWMQQRTHGRLPFLIALTGNAEAEMRRRCFEDGIHLHLLKPVDPEFLKKLLNRFKDIICK